MRTRLFLRQAHALFVSRLAITIAASAGIAGAQPGGQAVGRTRAPIPAFSAFWVSTGTLLMDVSKLNPHFERLDLAPTDRPGFFTLSNDGYSLGVGGYGPVMGRIVLGGEWNTASMGEEASPSGKTNAISTRYWMGTLGFAAWTNWRINVIPFAGIGLGKVKLTLKSRDGGPTVPDTRDPTFDEIILSPGSSSQVDGSYVMVQPGVAVDFLVLNQTSQTIGLTLGVRFSSVLSPNRTSWTYNGRDVFGGPDTGPTGGSVKVILGVGGFRMGGSR
jgi:hypothetical protein